MNKTKIEWADSTWNPVTGCLHGCEYCYARKIAQRFGGTIQQGDIEANIHDLHEPMYTENNMGNVTKAPYPYNFDPTFHRYRLGDPALKTKPQNIFVCSMADLFGDWVPDEWIKAVFEACKAAPQHRYLFLTKHPERYTQDHIFQETISKRNFWFGTTACNQDDFNCNAMKLPLYKNCFVSIEPIHGAINTTVDRFNDLISLPIKWVIIGAETGNRKGKVIPEKQWVDDIVADCDNAKVPVFMKDSLLPIMGEENMRREFPWNKEEKQC